MIGNASLLLIFLSLVFCMSCKKSPGPNPVPYVVVNQKIDISKPAYNILTIQGGYVYLVGVGNKGIVVILNFDGNYYALDRTCPYHVNSSCGVITMAYNGT